MSGHRPPSSSDAGIPSDADTWFVVCLCAQWCGVCRQYRAGFEALQRQHFAQWHFVWLDVEDDAPLLGDLELETFPTLLIAQGGQATFMGALPPQTALLQRLLNALASLGGSATDSATPDEQTQALWQRLYAHFLATGITPTPEHQQIVDGC